ncbi:hypothetical protein KSS87_001806 [Heliosperma pusillum]|nr:hypothetical protein KSS87_001806 [Heliosperma pusillum]
MVWRLKLAKILKNVNKRIASCSRDVQLETRERKSKTLTDFYVFYSFCIFLEDILLYYACV